MPTVDELEVYMILISGWEGNLSICSSYDTFFSNRLDNYMFRL